MAADMITALATVVIFVMVTRCQSAPLNQTYQIGQMPIECTTWMDCYPTREPLLAVGSEWRYTTKGCACEHDEAYGELSLFCGIERRRENELKLEMVPCVYCGSECNSPDFYTRNADALNSWQNRRTARFRPVAAGAQPPADTNNAGPDTVGAPLNLYPGGQAPSSNASSTNQNQAVQQQNQGQGQSQSQPQNSQQPQTIGGQQQQQQSQQTGQAGAAQDQSSATNNGAQSSQVPQQVPDNATIQQLLQSVADLKQQLAAIEAKLRSFKMSKK